MNKFSGYIALLVVFFVVFLGMRNPWLDHTPGPKRKGKAVITNFFNKNLTASCVKENKVHDNGTPLAILLSPSTTLHVSSTASLPVAGEDPYPSRRYHPTSSCRAPPAPLS